MNKIQPLISLVKIVAIISSKLFIMSIPYISYLAYLYDIAITTTTMAFARLLPPLSVPLTDLTGRVAIVTGGNSGIGFQIVLELAKRGSTVYIACPDTFNPQDTTSQIISQDPALKDRIHHLTLDLSSPSSIRTFANTWSTLHLPITHLFHNAGIGAALPGEDFTPSGLPTVYATNFLGSFLLTHLLEPHLAPTARIILTTSSAHHDSVFSSTFSLTRTTDSFEPGFHLPFPAAQAPYPQTKAMQIAFAALLQKRFDRSAAATGTIPTEGRRTAHAFSPGFVRTSLFDQAGDITFFAEPYYWLLKKMMPVVAIEAGQGAATAVWLATTGEESVIGEGKGGGYWDRMTRRLSSVDMMRKEDVERFWVRWEADAGIEWR